MHSTVSTLSRLAALTACALAAQGCGGKNYPKTYPVTGTVVWANGQPVAGGSVDFRKPADTTFTVVGHLGADGTFSLSTIVGRDKISGAPEGEYKVSVTPETSGHGRKSYAVPNTYMVKPDQENRFEIKLGINPPKD